MMGPEDGTDSRIDSKHESREPEHLKVTLQMFTSSRLQPHILDFFRFIHAEDCFHKALDSSKISKTREIALCLDNGCGDVCVLQILQSLFGSKSTSGRRLLRPQAEAGDEMAAVAMCSVQFMSKIVAELILDSLLAFGEFYKSNQVLELSSLNDSNAMSCYQYPEPTVSETPILLSFQQPPQTITTRTTPSQNRNHHQPITPSLYRYLTHLRSDKLPPSVATAQISQLTFPKITREFACATPLCARSRRSTTTLHQTPQVESRAAGAGTMRAGA